MVCVHAQRENIMTKIAHNAVLFIFNIFLQLYPYQIHIDSIVNVKGYMQTCSGWVEE